MSRRTALVRRTTAGVASPAPASELAKLANDVRDVDATSEIILPRDHPRWLRDRFTVSSATKALIDRIAPIVIRVFGFWDHRVHHIAVESGTIDIDMSGSYRCNAHAEPLKIG